MTTQLSFEFISKALLLMQKPYGKTELTETESECIHDALSGLSLGKIAYTQWRNSWLVQYVGNMTEDDVEYMDTVSAVNYIVRQIEGK